MSIIEAKLEKWLAAFITCQVAIIYLTGYAYLDGFFEYFGVSLQELQYGPQSILAHAAPAIKNEMASSGAMTVFLLLFVFTIFIIASRGIDALPLLLTAQKQHWHILGTIVLLIVVLITLKANFAAHSIGFENARREYLNLNRMVVLGAPSNFDIDGYRERNPSSNLYHLTTTENTHFAVIKRSGEKRRWVVRIPKTDSIAIRVFQDLTY